MKRWCYRACLMSTQQRVVQTIQHLTHSSALYKAHRLVSVTVERSRGAGPAFTATFSVIFLNYFPKSLGNPSLLAHSPCLWTFLKMVLRAGCLCVSLPLAVTYAHTCTHTHTHAKGSWRERLLSLVGAAARVLQAATHGPVSVLEIL